MTVPFPYRQKTFALGQVDDMARAIREDGFALVPDVLSPAEVAALREATDRLRPFGLDHSNAAGDHYKCVFNRDRVFLDLIDRPGIVDLAEKTMGEQCHIIGETAWRSRPGHDGWAPHADQVWVTVPESNFDDPGFELPVYVCTAHYYLSDIPTVSHSPTYVIPGSHKSGRGIGWGADLSPDLARQDSGAGPGEGGRRAVLPQRDLAFGQQEHLGRDALPAASALLAPLHQPEVLALAVPVQPRGPGDRQ